MSKIYIKALIVFFSCISAASCYGQSYDPKENSVYIYNFIKYTSWPQKKSVIHVGIVGNSQVEEELKRLFSKKTSNGTTYTVKKITSAEAKTVDVVIVAQQASEQMRSIEQQTARTPVLIITEKENMARQGACISFFIDEENDYKTGYQLSIRNCKARGLSVNEQIQNNAVLTR
ncbi:YfiR family protein [Flavipsychrobacter stenotrophus]|uniref:YfiR family protein n=1 Tax=Flavipsychrobacter stenotrophus TaxID=2077091 RepID=UPI001374DAC4|nr:YfiR family protein [Flavipsychrobacter stenotrophus]